MPIRIAVCCGVALLLGSRSIAAGEGVDYLRQIKPLLADKCYVCHGALQQKAGLRLDTVKFIREGSDKGPILVSGNSGKSRLVDHIQGRNGAPQMPPASDGDPFSPAQVALIRKWIDGGVQGPVDEKPEADPREHWAFRSPVRPSLPRLKNATRARNPIDMFIAAEWEKRGLRPQPLADRATLLRRVYLDLIGLPPTREELHAFVNDSRADAFEKVVDRLLASSQYGERWGRHWMDIWRYSDWWGLGQEVRNSQKHIWHWRDWIVESLNADKGYDQMAREMLAADEICPDDLDRLRATGYLVRPYFIFNRTTWLDEVIEHTGKAFLGLTMNCAKCHDHKYDPIRQKDYYRFRAFFEPYQIRTDQAPGETDYEKDGIPRVFDCNLETPTYLFYRGDDRQPVKDRPLGPGLPRLLLWSSLEITPISLPAAGHSPGLRPFVLENYLRAADKKIKTARAALDLARVQLAQAKPASVEQARAAVLLAEKALAVAELEPQILKARAAAERAKAQDPAAAGFKNLARQAAVLERMDTLARAEEALARAELDLLGAPGAKKTEAEKKRQAAQNAILQARKALANPGETYAALRGSLKTRENNLETEASRNKPFPKVSSGRRAALARWLTDRRNPLAARVAVNHIWGRHFGRPLVPTVFDFGRKGAPPTHPELLDYLAVEFMEHDWSMKHLHRLIVTSTAYRLSSSAAGVAAKTRELDAENRWCWRMNPIRMDAQVLRDSLLCLAGELDRKMGGPSIPVADETSRRRSIYFVHSHNDNQKFLAMFDDASVHECYRRSESIVPQQSLALANSRQTFTAAAKINERLHQALGPVSDAAFIRAAFETVLAVSPSAQEEIECKQALRDFGNLVRGRPDAARRARGNLIHALLNHNDFITVR